MSITSTLYEDASDVLDALTKENVAFAERYPGDRPDRQPIHTVYGGAQLFKASTTQKLGELGLRSMDAFAGDAITFAKACGIVSSDLDGEGSRARYEADEAALRKENSELWLAHAVWDRVRAKLQNEPVEDFRIDFEDGFGSRPDDEEDMHAERAAKEVAKGMKEGTLPPFLGIRIKPLNDELKRRSVRTLDIFLTTLVNEAGGLPENFVVTLPKIPVAAQVSALVKLFEKLEAKLGLESGSLKMELMIELTQSLLAEDGRSNLPLLLEAAEGRCTGAHFGTYDYTASCSITAAYQKMDHPACDFALNMMKIAFANTGVWLSDGATNVMPVAPHRTKDGALSAEQVAENNAAVHSAWLLAADHIRHSLKNGFYQGWDLHPAQLPVRYATAYAFFLEGFDAAAERLSNFVEKAAQATLVGDVFDDAATGQGLLNYFLRGMNSGAVSLEELASTGLSVEEIRTRSFAKIMKLRSGA